MAQFRKYEFPSEEIYLQLKEQFLDSPHIFVELGILRDDKYSVDVLWSAGAPGEWGEYEIWDVQGNGSHTFSGWEFQNQ